MTLSDYKITNQIVFHKPVGEGSDNPQVILHVRHIVRDYRPEHRRGLEGSVVITVKDKDVHESIELPVKIGKSGEEVIEGDIKLRKVQLWSPDYPYLYNITFQLFDQNCKELDRETWRWGFREFKIDGNRFLLNNSPFVLCGINRL